MDSIFLSDTEPETDLSRHNSKVSASSGNLSVQCNPNLLYFDVESDNCHEDMSTPGTTPVNVNQTDLDPFARDENLAQIEIFVQIIIFILAVVGNGTVLFALRYRKKKTSRMRFFIMHLTIADLLVAFLNILPQLAWDITFRFQGNDFMCRTVKYMQVVVIYLSTYILVMTSIDRYRAICHPLTFYKWTRKHCNIAVAVIWCLSLLFASPQLYIFGLTEIGNGTGVYDCWGSFNPEWTVIPYVTMFCATVYIVPFCIMSFLYGRICYEVCKNFFMEKRSFASGQSFGNGIVYKFNGTGHISVIGGKPMQRQSNETPFGRTNTRRHASLRVISRSKMKTVKLTFVVVIAYMICWSPFMIAQLWWAYDPNAPINSAVFVLCLLLASLNSCVNPWIYMAFSGNLMRQIIPCFRQQKPKLRQRVRSVDDIQQKQGQEKLLGNDKPEANGEAKNSSTQPNGIRLMSLKNTLFSKSQPTKMTGTSDSLKSRLAVGRFNHDRDKALVTRDNNGFWLQNGSNPIYNCPNRNAHDLPRKQSLRSPNVKYTSV